MGLPKIIESKLNTYTLFCHQLLRNLSALNNATCTDPHLTTDECLKRFNQSLHYFLKEAAPRSIEQGVDELSAVLQGRVALFRTQNPDAASVFDQVIQAAKDAVSSWDYQKDLKAFHQQGRQLALRFYSSSPWPVTQERLNREAQLLFCAEEETFYPTPMAFRAHHQDDQTGQKITDVILVYFGFNWFNYDFGLYLAYPHLFMHEYIAHIFATDYGNERFNDGWLLYAANAFLRRHGWDLLTREQIRAFEKYLYRKLRPVTQRAYDFAKDFDAWLGDSQRFQAMTWELAAFEPRSGESWFWPNEFINRLEQEFDHNRSRLQDKIRAAPDVRTLYDMLSPV